MTTAVAEQFTQTDPLQADIGSPYPSAYVYGNNNPLVFTDPSGLRAQVAAGNPIAEQVPNELAQVASGPEVLDPKDRTSQHNVLVEIQYRYCFARHGSRCQRDLKIAGASKKGTGNFGKADLVFVTQSGTHQVAEVKSWSEKEKVVPEATAYAAAITASTGAPATLAVTYDPAVWVPVGGFTIGGKAYTFTAVPGGFVYKDVDRKPRKRRVRVKVPNPIPVLEEIAETP